MVSVGLTHLQITSIAGLPITVPYLTASPILFYIFCQHIKRGVVVATLCAGFFPLVLLVGQLATFDISVFSVGSFIKSYFMYLAAILVFMAIISLPVLTIGDRLWSLACLILAIPCIFLVLQCFEFNLLDGRTLLRPFGDFTRVGPGGVAYEPYYLAPVKKVAGTMSEPSAAAWFAGSCFVFASYLPGIRFSSLLRNSAMLGMLSTLSVSGAVNFFVLVYVAQFISSSSSLTGSRVGRYLQLALFLSLAGVVIFGVGLYDHTMGRVERVFEGGHSLYYRLVAPVYLLSDLAAAHPFGVPLGDSSFISDKAYMHNTQLGSETNLDSVFVWSCFHFGVFGFAFCLLFLARTVWGVITKKREVTLWLVFVVLIFSEAGSIVNLSTLVVVTLPLLAAIRDAHLLEKRSFDSP